MPAYAWMLERSYDKSLTPSMINAMRTLGVPYAEGYENQANLDVDAQAEKIVKNLKEAGIETTEDKEIVAMIAYLQRMGTDIKVKEEMAVK